MKKLLLIMMVLFTTVAMAQQPQLTWRFANAQLINGDTQMQFDVEVMSDLPGYAVYIAQLGFEYDTDAFGTNINGSGNVTIEMGPFLSNNAYGVPTLFQYNLISVGDPFQNTLGATVQTAFPAGAPILGTTHTAWPTAWEVAFIVTIEVDPAAAPGALAGVHFWQVGMDGQESCQIGPVPPVSGLVLCMDPNFYDNNLDDFVVVPGGPMEVTWTGAVDGDFFNGDNWNPAQTTPVPDGLDLVVPDVSATKAPWPVITGAVATTGTLTIAPGGQLDIGYTGGLTTNGLFTNDGIFRIIDGSFIDNGGLMGMGTYEFERFLTPDPDPQSASTFGWHFVSSPVSNSVSGDFVAYWLKEWDADGNTYLDLDPWGDGNTVNCEPTDYSFGNVPLNVMQGYSVKLDNDYPIQPGSPVPCPVVIPGNDATINFGGDVLFGDPGFGNFVPNATNAAYFGIPTLDVNNLASYSANVTWNGTPGSGLPFPDDGPYHMWNLVGNPYSASIDNALFTAGFPVGVNASISYWDDLNQTYAVWAAGVGAPYIPPTQGFMVEVGTAGTYPIGVTTAMRTHMGAAMFYKQEVNDLVTLQATGNGFADKTYIRFHDEATSGFDRVYDAHKLISSTSGVPQIYTTMEGEVLAINALPATSIVPMAFLSDASGEFTIEAIETSDFANVVLEDRMTGEQTDLLTSTYTFNYSVNDDTDRFFVHFTPLGTPELSANSIQIWSNDHKIYVQAPEIDGDIAVFNMMGQEVIRAEIEPGLNILPVNDRNSYYVVKVVSDDVARTGKVYVK